MQNNLSRGLIVWAPKIPRFFLLLVVLVFPFLAGCQGTQNPQFKIVDQGEEIGSPDQSGYSSPYPDLRIITSPDQIIKNPPYNVHFGKEIIPKLEAVDYQTNFVIIVFRGVIGGTLPIFRPEILKVTRDSNLVTVYAHFGTSAGFDMAMSSPYTAIQVNKSRKWAQMIRFQMRLDVEQFATTEYIP